jgi:hypothetical protein
MTFAADYLGQYLHNGPRVVNSPFSGMNGAVVPRIGQQYTDYGMNNAGLGLKYAIGKQLVLTGNVLFRLDDNGLRQTVTPMVGISYGH